MDLLLVLLLLSFVQLHLLISCAKTNSSQSPALGTPSPLPAGLGPQIPISVATYVVFPNHWSLLKS